MIKVFCRVVQGCAGSDPKKERGQREKHDLSLL